MEVLEQHSAAVLDHVKWSILAIASQRNRPQGFEILCALHMPDLNVPVLVTLNRTRRVVKANCYGMF